LSQNKGFRFLELKEKNVKAPEIVRFRMMKERVKCIAVERSEKLVDVLFKAVYEALKVMPNSNQEEKNDHRKKIIRKIEKKYGVDEKHKVHKYERVYYPGTSNKPFNQMTEREFENYINNCKRCVTKAFNMGVKCYLLRLMESSPDMIKFKLLFEKQA
jgi:hypothetical protein